MFTVDPMARQPVYEQIVEQTERFLLTGTLSPGDQLPSVRSLSLELVVNPNTILKAYNDLDKSGIIRSVPGKGYFVCEGAMEVLGQRYRKDLSLLRQTVSEMALSGIKKEEILSIVEEIYQSANLKGDQT